jgi:acid phosphatase (class A)
MHKNRFSRIPLFLVLVLSTLTLAAEPKYVRVEDVDWESILQSPPADDSAQHHAEVDALLGWQKQRSPEDIARCQEEASADAFYFAKVLGPWFKKDALPHTAQLLASATDDAKIISSSAKDHFKRPRPFVADDRIQPCVERETSASYPSGHAMRGILWATILGELFPEHHAQLMALGQQFGEDRVVGGVHYPSDVKAGQELGAAIAKKLLENPQFKMDLETARDECMAPAAH